MDILNFPEQEAHVRNSKRLQFKPHSKPSMSRSALAARRAKSSNVEKRRSTLETLESRNLLSAGALDPSFGLFGEMTTTFGSSDASVLTLAIEPDGKLIAAGQVHSQGFAVACYNPDGSPDPSFSEDGTLVLSDSGKVDKIFVQPDGKIVLAGSLDEYSGKSLVVRLTASGLLDPTFGDGGRVVLPIFGSGFALEPDGRIIVAEADLNAKIIRLNSNGSLDPTFGQGGIVTQPMPSGLSGAGATEAAAIQADGKIITLDSVTLSGANSPTSFCVARFNADGSLDASFGTGGRVVTDLGTGSATPNCVSIQPDGKIVAAGMAGRSVSGSDMALVRYNADGSLDSTFGSQGIAIHQLGASVWDSSFISRMLIEPNGTIVATGQAYAQAGVMRFHADGSLDDSFGNNGVVVAPEQNIPAGKSLVMGYGIVEQPDGKYVIAAIAGQPYFFALERFFGETPPIAAGIDGVTVAENSAPTIIPLIDSFSGGSVPADQLTYSLSGDTNPSLFTSVTINPQTGALVLRYQPNQSGTARLTVRASDPNGSYVETAFTVIVAAPPMADNDSYLIAAGGNGAATAVQGVLNNDVDPEGLALTAQLLDGPMHGELDLHADGSFNYIAGADFHGFDEFTYQSFNGLYSNGPTIVRLLSPAASIIDKLYRQTLHRSADDEGLQFWTAKIEQGASYGAVAQHIFESDERLNPIIEQYYSDFLLRQADLQGLAYWRDQVWRRDGGPDNVIAGMISSAEFFQSSGGTNAAWATAIYERLLDRQPDPQGLTYWAGQLDEQSRSRSHVVLAFLDSDENLKNLAEGWYQQYLNREPQADEQAAVVAELHAGVSQRQVQINLINGQEYRNAPAPPADGGVVRLPTL